MSEESNFASNGKRRPSSAESAKRRLTSAEIQELFECMKSTLICFFWRRGHDDATTDDLVQKTFVEVCQGQCPTNEAERRKWVQSIACRQSALVYRLWYERKGKLGRIQPEDNDAPRQSNLDERLEELRLARSKLTPQHREIIYLRFYEGCSYDQIASQLDIPLGTVKSRLHAAMQELKSHFPREPEERQPVRTDDAASAASAGHHFRSAMSVEQADVVTSPREGRL